MERQTVSRTRLLIVLFALVALAVACSTPTAPPSPTEAKGPAPATQSTAATPSTATASNSASPTSAQPAPTQAPTGPQGELVVVASEEPKSVCPMIYMSQASFFVSSTVSWGLVAMDWKTGKVAPRLAERWEMVTPSQWRFYLRKDFKWQNGKPITAEDIAWNINLETDPSASSPETTPRIQRYVAGKNLAKAIDPYTVEINLPAPNPILPNGLLWLYLHEPSSYKENPKICDQTPISNGPYMLVERRIGEYFRFEANPYFAGDPKPEFKSIKMVFRTEPTVRAAMVAKSEAAVAYNIGPQASSLVPKAKVQPATDVIVLRLDSRFHPNFKDVRFRQALQYAINCDEIVKTIQMGYGQCVPVTSVPGMASIPADIKPYPYDPNKAKQLLKEAGMENAEFTMYIRLIGRFPFEAETYQAMVAYWKAVGLKVNLQVQETSSYIEWSKTSTGLAPDVTQPPKAPLPTYLFPMSTEMMDTAGVLSPYASCKGNLSLFCDASVDALFTKSLAAAGDERLALTQQLVRKVYEQEPIVTLFTMAYIAGMSSNIEYSPAPNGDFVLNDIRRAK